MAASSSREQAPRSQKSRVTRTVVSYNIQETSYWDTAIDVVILQDMITVYIDPFIPFVAPPYEVNADWTFLSIFTTVMAKFPLCCRTECLINVVLAEIQK